MQRLPLHDSLRLNTFVLMGCNVPRKITRADLKALTRLGAVDYWIIQLRLTGVKLARKWNAVPIEACLRITDPNKWVRATLTPSATGISKVELHTRLRLEVRADVGIVRSALRYSRGGEPMGGEVLLRRKATLDESGLKDYVTRQLSLGRLAGPASLEDPCSRNSGNCSAYKHLSGAAPSARNPGQRSLQSITLRLAGVINHETIPL